MDRETLTYIESLEPDLDVHGQWACTGNAKTAQKSIMLGALYHRQIRRRRGPRSWQVVWDQMFVPRSEDVFWFTVVRNPYDRLVSAFHFLQQRHVGVINSKWSFTSYVKEVLLEKGKEVDKHFKDQHPSCTYRKKLIPGMFIGRFENLQSDWVYIADKVGVPRELEHINRSRHSDYKEYYDRDTFEIVTALYARDLEMLNYSY